MCSTGSGRNEGQEEEEEVHQGQSPQLDAKQLEQFGGLLQQSFDSWGRVEEESEEKQDTSGGPEGIRVPREVSRGSSTLVYKRQITALVDGIGVLTPPVPVADSAIKIIGLTNPAFGNAATNLLGTSRR